MRLLLDTHALLWALTEPSRLSDRARAAIEDRANELVVSAASAWEVATKYRARKLPGAEPLIFAYSSHLERLGARELPMTSAHALTAGTLSWDHRDPFDRMLAAQSVLESAALVTTDAAFRTIAGIQLLW